MTKRTKNLRIARNIFAALQLLSILGTVGTLITIALRGVTFSGDLAAKLGSIIYPLTVSCLITGMLLFVVGFKIRGALWMVSLILSSYLFDTPGMWTVFSIWAASEYIIYPLYKHFNQKLSINKELDKRL